ncbi:MAG: hypothetical protein RX318_00610 [bacterium]|nr:hypothetical protein [bacterium]
MFNLFDVLVVGVLLIGLPLGFWAYSTAEKSLEEDGGNLMASWGISGPDHARQTFRIVLLNTRMPQSVFAKMEPGEVIYDRAGRRSVGMVHEVTLIEECMEHPYKSVVISKCPVKVVVDLKCVEAESKIRCLKEAVRIGNWLKLATKFYNFSGDVMDIHRLGDLLEPKNSSDRSPPSGEKAPQKTSGDHPPPSGEKVSQKTSGDHPPPSGEKVSQKTSGDHPPPSGEKVSQKTSGDHPPPSGRKMPQETFLEEEE